MTRNSLLLAGCFALLCSVSCAACDKPADTPQSPVQVPDYTVAGDETPDQDMAAVLATWHKYQDAMFESLSSSSNPRDWAVATMASTWPLDEVGNLAPGKHDDLIERAMRALPDDVPVQWIAMNHGPATHDAALQALHALEPDNAAVWNEDLIAATKRNDHAGISTALTKMSGSRRFDVHYADLLKAATEAFLRNPVPQTHDVAANGGNPPSKDDLAYTNAMTITATSALPAFQHLVNACRIDPASGKNSEHAADCAAIGRLMAEHGDTLVANRIGTAVLRVSHTYTDDDLKVARNVDWVYQKTTDALTKQTDADTAKDFAVRYRDWIETGNEVESMRRALVRQGTAPTPPEDWVDRLSSFSAERQRTDAAWFEKMPRSSSY